MVGGLGHKVPKGLHLNNHSLTVYSLHMHLAGTLGTLLVEVAMRLEFKVIVMIHGLWPLCTSVARDLELLQFFGFRVACI